MISLQSPASTTSSESSTVSLRNSGSLLYPPSSPQSANTFSAVSLNSSAATSAPSLKLPSLSKTMSSASSPTVPWAESRDIKSDREILYMDDSTTVCFRRDFPRFEIFTSTEQDHGNDGDIGGGVGVAHFV
ncbi:hypothetical protein Q3G72_000254 [Acer saccharum]|nr:hypothetical protein Q3G72_000254 [Acer saccharum]